MKARARFTARPRHPVTGAQLFVSAATAAELARRVGAVQAMRGDLRVGLTTPEQVTDKLARMRHGAVTLERAARSYMESGLAPNTRRRVASALATHLRELAPLELGELEAPRLVRWVERLRGGRLAASTITLQWRTLRAVVRHAAERGWIARAPWGAWRPSPARGGRAGRDRLPREAARSPRELAELLAAARILDTLTSSRTQTIDEPHGRLGDLAPKIGAAALLGLRQGELAALRWTDVDAPARAVTIARAGGGEGGPTKARTVDVLEASPVLFELLEVHRLELEDRGLYDPGGPVFPSERRSIPGTTVAPYPERAEVLSAAALRRAVRRAELPAPERWTPHSLRDSFVTLENAGAGGDLRAVAARSRHASLGSLVRYLRARERTARPAPFFELPPAASAPALDRRGGAVVGSGGA